METTEEKELEYRKAFDRLTRYLAQRDHSRFELEQKLLRFYTPELVANVIKDADARGWIAPDEDIATRAALAYERKLKSRAYIEGQLRKRRLPVPFGYQDENSELNKARLLIERKFGSLDQLSSLSFADRARIFRYLKNRGFSDRWIRQVLNEKP